MSVSSKNRSDAGERMKPQVLEIPNEVMIPAIKAFIDEGRTTTFIVRGYSMRLFLEHERDKVILQHVQEPVKKGDVVLAEIAPKRYVLHRIVRCEGGNLTLRGDGNMCGVEHCKESDVIGIAIGFYRKGRTKPDMVSGLKWRMYSAIWLALTPFRRYILAFYRRIWLRIF